MLEDYAGYVDNIILLCLCVDVRPKRLKVEGERGGVQEGRRQNESPSKHRSLNDPETVRMNAKKALYQTLWKRFIEIDIRTSHKKFKGIFLLKCLRIELGLVTAH